MPARDLLRMIAEATHQCGDPGMQFDTTINEWHTCPNTGRINASNPCSEYMHLDDSACNLASLNLLQFSAQNGTFDVAAFRHAVDVAITAQDILVEKSSYPTPAIGAQRAAYRELGLGYANLGALLMSLGLPYDSEAGRQYAAPSRRSCAARRTSSRRGSRAMGPYEGYPRNASRSSTSSRSTARTPTSSTRARAARLLAAARDAWDEALASARSTASATRR